MNNKNSFVLAALLAMQFCVYSLLQASGEAPQSPLTEVVEYNNNVYRDLFNDLGNLCIPIRVQDDPRNLYNDHLPNPKAHQTALYTALKADALRAREETLRKAHQAKGLERLLSGWSTQAKQAKQAREEALRAFQEVRRNRRHRLRSLRANEQDLCAQIQAIQEQLGNLKSHFDAHEALVRPSRSIPDHFQIHRRNFEEPFRDQMRAPQIQLLVVQAQIQAIQALEREAGAHQEV